MNSGDGDDDTIDAPGQLDSLSQLDGQLQQLKSQLGREPGGLPGAELLESTHRLFERFSNCLSRRP